MMTGVFAVCGGTFISFGMFIAMKPTEVRSVPLEKGTVL